MSDLDEARAIRYFLDAFCDRDTIRYRVKQKKDDFVINSQKNLG